MKFKQLCAWGLGLSMMLSLTACGNTPSSDSTTASVSAASSTGASEVSSEVSSEASSEDTPAAARFTLSYPQDMQAQGYTDPLVLDAAPERIACMSTYPVMALYELGAPMIAVPTTTVLTYPDDLDAERLPGMMSDDFDLESVVAMEPDLVIMPTANAGTYGETLAGLGIPVYYVAISSQTLPVYQVVKNQTQALVDAFSLDEASTAAGTALMTRFADLEARLEALRPNYEGKTVMTIVISDPTTHYLQTGGGTLGSMLTMMGFENVYENSAATMVPLDMETALAYQPDLVVFTGSLDAAGMESLTAETIAQNPGYWNSIPAIQNGEVLSLSSAYVSTAGINILHNISDLIDTIEAHYEN